MDIEQQKKRKQIIFIIVGLAVAVPLIVYWQLIRPSLLAKAQRAHEQAAQQTAAQPATAVTTAASGATAAPGAPGAPGAPAAPSMSLEELLATAEPVLPSRSDPFGLLGAMFSLVPSAYAGERSVAAAALFSRGWGVAERDGTTAGGRGDAQGPPLSPVRMPALNVTPSSTPPLPSISPTATYQRVPQPGSIEELLPVTREIPSVPSPQMEGMRLAGIVRTGQPRGILEWKTPQGTSRSQVVAPNQPLVWPLGGSVEMLGSDYAIVKDAQGGTWRVPLR